MKTKKEPAVEQILEAAGVSGLLLSYQCTETKSKN
jgi:hypothetical protein